MTATMVTRAYRASAVRFATEAVDAAEDAVTAAKAGDVRRAANLVRTGDLARREFNRAASKAPDPDEDARLSTAIGQALVAATRAITAAQTGPTT